MVGLSVLHRLNLGSPTHLVLVVLVGLGAVAIVLACASRIGRPAVALLGVSVLMLLLTPSWFAQPGDRVDGGPRGAPDPVRGPAGGLHPEPGFPVPQLRPPSRSFRAHHGYSTYSVAAVERWPVLATSGRYVVRIRPYQP